MGGLDVTCLLSRTGWTRLDLTRNVSLSLARLDVTCLLDRTGWTHASLVAKYAT